MNFTEIRNEVLRMTKRPDKTTETDIAINKAVSFFTLKGDFPRDFLETTINIDSTLYGDSVSLSALTRFRKFKFVKPTGKRYYLTPLAPEKIFTPKDNTQPNVYYISGTSLTYTLSELNSSLEVGYFSYAPTLDDTVLPTHWMFDQMPYAIIDTAASIIFTAIGDEKSAAFHAKTGLDFFLVVRRDIVSGE